MPPVPADPVATVEQIRARRPKVYFSVFNNGYSGDPLPKDDAQFEKLVRTVKEEGRFNAVLCKHTDAREKICAQHGMLMMVDLLSDEHHLHQPATWKNAQTLCERLRGNGTILAYHLWSDRFGAEGQGRRRDIRNVQTWDPTHPTYTGTYQSQGLEFLAESDFVSYYDFSWKRGPEKNFANLLAAWNTARRYDGRIGRYSETDAGQAGQGNASRLQYLQTTSIACGLRGTMYFIGSQIMDLDACRFNQLGLDVAQVNGYLAPMREEIAKLGLPTAIYSTPWTSDWNGKRVESPQPGPVYPPALQDHAFSKECWIQPVQGEFVMGLSKYEDGARDAIFIANHNAYGGQDVSLKLDRPNVVPEIFNRQAGRYEPMPIVDGTVSFKLDPAGGTIILFR